MGHSRGGHIAFRVAQQRPDLLRKLVLAEPGGELDASLDPTAPPRPSPLRARGSAADRLRECQRRRYRRRARDFRRCDRRRRRLEAPAGGGEAAAARQRLHAARPGPRERASPFAKANAESIRTPTLLIGGGDTTGSAADGLARAGCSILPARKTAMIPGTHHWMFEQAPQEFSRDRDGVSGGLS